MRLLTIDLGQTSGYCYFVTLDEPAKPALMNYGTFALGGRLPTRFKPDLVIVERPAHGPAPNHLQERYDDTLAYLRETYERVEVIRAITWMARFKHAELPGRGVLPTQHEKDAYRMGLWALDREEERRAKKR